MTLREAIDQRVPRVRDLNWGPTTYLRLPLLAEGIGPWAELYDDEVQQNVLHIRPGSQRLMTLPGMGLNFDSKVEAYTGPISPFESHEDNFARAYLEA